MIIFWIIDTLGLFTLNKPDVFYANIQFIYSIHSGIFKRYLVDFGAFNEISSFAYEGFVGPEKGRLYSFGWSDDV